MSPVAKHRRTANWGGGKAALVRVQIVCCSLDGVVLSNGRWDLSSALPTPDSFGKWILFPELGGSSLQHSSERCLSSAVPVAPAPGLGELDTLPVCAYRGWVDPIKPP